jgi:hypothetical protein
MTRCRARQLCPKDKEGMTQTNLTRLQGLSRIDLALRDAAAGLGVAEFRAESLAAERAHAYRSAAARAASVDTGGVTVQSRSIAGPDGRQLAFGSSEAKPNPQRQWRCTPTAVGL